MFGAGLRRLSIHINHLHVKKSRSSIVIIAVLLLLVCTGGITIWYLNRPFKEKVIDISSEELSKLTGMDIRFESYRLLSPMGLEIKNLTIRSPYPIEDYKTVNEYHTDWIEAKIGTIRLVAFDYEQFIKNRKFHASSLEIDTATVDVYRDKTLPDPPFNVKPLVATLLRSLEADIKLDTIYLRKINIAYREKTDASETPGIIRFQDLYSTGYNLTNDSATLQENSLFTLDALSFVMGQNQVEANIIFHLDREDDFFTFAGEMKPFDITILNPMLSGLLPADIKSGEVKKLTFQFQATDHKATGEVDFQYDDLVLNVYKEADDEKKSLLGTLAANVAIRSKNLEDQRTYRKGTIDFERNQDRFIFNYWWNSLKSGVTDVILTDVARLFLQKNDSGD